MSYPIIPLPKADWQGAILPIGYTAWEYYEHSKDHYILHPETRRELETCLQILRDQGEDACFTHIRTQLLGKQK